MKKLINISLIFLFLLTLVFLILKLNIFNLAYQAVFFTNKDVSIFDVKVNSEHIHKQSSDDKKRIYPITINTFYPTEISLGNQKRYIKVKELKKDKYININIISFKDKKLKRLNYHLYLLHNGLPELNIENKGINKGYILTNYTKSKEIPAHVLIMDMKGNIVFFRINRMPKYSVFNLQKWKTKNNEVFYGLHEQTVPSLFGKYTGKELILDKKFNVIDEVKILPTSKHPELEADEHDFVFLEKNHYIAHSSWFKKIANITYIDSVIQEIKDNKVVLDFVASEHKEILDNNFLDVVQTKIGDTIYNTPALIDNSSETRINKNNKNTELINDNYKKCFALGSCQEFHPNSLIIDPVDNNILASFKYKNAVIKIDRNTGEILWQLGGLYDNFNLSKEEKFKFQHHAYFGRDDTLYVFDNLSHNPSRIAKYKFDKEHKNIIKKEFIDLDSYVDYFGSSQLIDNNKMIVSYGNGLKQAINIIDSKGNVYWSAKFSDDVVKIKKTQLIPNRAIYRAYYYETID